VDEAVKNGIVKPGQYLVLEFDFSCLAGTPGIDEAVVSLRREINRGLLQFKRSYANDLGPSFASAPSRFTDNDPAGNLADLVYAVDYALEDIQKRGEEDHPLRDVRGVCLFYITAYHSTF
jgi:hypothetical protein